MKGKKEESNARVLRVYQLGPAIAAAAALGGAASSGEFKLRVARIAAACRRELEAVQIAERQLYEQHVLRDEAGKRVAVTINGVAMDGSFKVKDREAYDTAQREILMGECQIVAPTVLPAEIERLAEFAGDIEGILPFIQEA